MTNLHKLGIVGIEIEVELPDYSPGAKPDKSPCSRLILDFGMPEAYHGGERKTNYAKRMVMSLPEMHEALLSASDALAAAMRSSDNQKYSAAYGKVCHALQLINGEKS